MRIRMLTTVRGAEDGFTVRTYEKGMEYALAETPRGKDLGAVFLREKWAETLQAAEAVATPPPAPPAESQDATVPAVAAPKVDGKKRR
jgi:hypothetical protein